MINDNQANGNNSDAPQYYNSVRAMRVLLSCAAGMQSVTMQDELYQRRPLEIFNARKHLFKEQRVTETMQTLRQRQRVLRQEMRTNAGHGDWSEHSELQRELLERWEDDIRQYRYTEFWQNASLLIVAEYQHILAAARQEQNSETPGLPSCMEEHETTTDAIETEKAAKILHAAVGNSHCPLSLQGYAILLYEPLLAVPDADNLDRLPLHVAAQNYNSAGDEAAGQLLSQLVRVYPQAARARDRDGRFPLSLALRRRRATTANTSLPDEAHPHAGKAVWTEGLNALIDANPLALLGEDIGLLADNNGILKSDASAEGGDDRQACLQPQVFARLSADALFPLLLANPALLTRYRQQHP